MPNPEYLTTREFDTWREGHDQKIDRILNHVESQTQFNLTITDRVATLDAKQTESNTRAAKVSTGISVVVSGIISGLLAWLSGAAGK